MSILRSFGLIGLSLSAMVGSAQAEALTIKYDISIMNISIGVANYGLGTAKDSYRVELNTKLSGLASLVTSSKGNAFAAGVIQNGQPVSSSYATSANNTEITRTVRISYSGGNVRGYEVTPPFEFRTDVVPLTEASKQGAGDPLSGTFTFLPANFSEVGPELCRSRIPVFDGSVRFDILLSYTGTRDVDIKGYQGKVAVCNARYVPFAGHRPERPMTKFMMNNKEMEVWMLPVPSLKLAVPARISVATPYGIVMIDASRITLPSHNPQ